jgi:predicted transcriptional regulator
VINFFHQSIAPREFIDYRSFYKNTAYPLELELLMLFISKNKAIALENLAKLVNRDKTIVFRPLQKMVILRIYEKETKFQKGG